MTQRKAHVRTVLRRYRSWLACLAMPAFAATSACSSSTQPPPDTYVAATFSPAFDAMNNDLCLGVSSSTSALTIGTLITGSVGPITQSDGSSQSDGTTGSQPVNVLCSVAAGFDFAAQAVVGPNPSDATQLNGSIVISGTADATSTATTDIQATISSLPNGGQYSESDCSLSPVFHGGTIPTSPPIALGRIWSHLSCPKMASTDGKSVKINGLVQTSMCHLEADFLFENCSQ